MWDMTVEEWQRVRIREDWQMPLPTVRGREDVTAVAYVFDVGCC